MASLVAIGAALAVVEGGDSTWGALGLAVVSGGIVGGAIVLVEGMLASAADQRSADSALRMQLTSTTELNGIDLTDRELAEIYLPGKDMVAARLLRARLAGSRLYYADLRYADLRAADLSGADLSGCTLRGADLSGANLKGAILNDSDLRDARFNGADLCGAQLVTVRLSGASFRGAQLDQASIANAKLDGVDFVAEGLEMAHLGAVEWDGSTVWPSSFCPPASQPVSDRDLSDLGLAEYLADQRRRTDRDSVA